MNVGRGYAVVERGTIDVRTVSPTRRAALVNWLVVRCGQMITNNMTDGDIEEMWALHRQAHGDMAEVYVHAVTVSIEQ